MVKFGVGFLGDSGPKAPIVLGTKILSLYCFANSMTLCKPWASEKCLKTIKRFSEAGTTNLQYWLEWPKEHYFLQQHSTERWNGSTNQFGESQLFLADFWSPKYPQKWMGLQRNGQNCFNLTISWHFEVLFGLMAEFVILWIWKEIVLFWLTIL